MGGAPRRFESGPSASGGEAGQGGAPRPRSAYRRFRHRFRPLLARPLVWLAVRTLPRLYVGYMRLVWATSRIDRGGMMRIHELVAKHDGLLALLWHEDVLLASYGYGRLGFRGDTLASVGDAGEVITRALELSGYRVFRGGSASRASRSRLGVLRTLIEHMREGPQVLYGLTVDGSKGPAYQLKPGGIAIARACGKPIMLVRMTARPCLRLRSWDRTVLPLPFGRIRCECLGPYFAAADAGEDDYERLRLELERDLIALAAQTLRSLGAPSDRRLQQAAERNAALLEAAPGESAGILDADPVDS